MKEFQPDYTNLVESAKNREVKRTPLYEHSVGYGVIETVTGKKLDFGDAKSLYTDYCNFFKNMGYDTVSFECGVVDILLEGGRLTGHRDPIITSVEELDKYPFEENIERFKKAYYPIMKTLIGCLPDGMKLVGGVGYGVFEVVQDLVGYENLCLIKYDDPTLYRLLFQRVGDMMFAIWKDFLKNFADGYCVLRFGDDLGINPIPCSRKTTLSKIFCRSTSGSWTKCIHTENRFYCIRAAVCLTLCRISLQESASTPNIPTKTI